MRCFKCEKSLEAVFEDSLQPYEAVCFYTYGNFGSKVYDSLNNKESLLLHICDECLLKHTSFIYTQKEHVETSYTYGAWNPEDPE